MEETKNWDIYPCEYTEGKCEVCGAEGQIQISDGVGRCQKCSVDWLIKKATE